MGFKSVSTSTLSCLKTGPTQSSLQLSGEWQNILPPLELCLRPFTGLPICDPNMTDPGSGDNRPANARASWSCLVSLNKWKNEDAWITERCPRSGLSDVKELRAGMGACGVSLYGATGSKIEGSKTSPPTNGTGNDSGVDLNSSCPKSQNAMTSSVIERLHDQMARTLLNIRRNYSVHWESVCNDFSRVIANWLSSCKRLRILSSRENVFSQQQPMSNKIAFFRSRPSVKTFWYAGKRAILILSSHLASGLPLIQILHTS